MGKQGRDRLAAWAHWKTKAIERGDFDSCLDLKNSEAELASDVKSLLAEFENLQKELSETNDALCKRHDKLNETQRQLSECEAQWKRLSEKVKEK